MTQLALPEAVPLAHTLVDRVARDNGVRILFIKGPAAVEQGLREQGTSVDVDVLVDPARLDVLRDRLADIGWVDEHPYSTPTAAAYSRTHRHPGWPCELDLHRSFPGLYADDQAAFELLWSRRVDVRLAGQGVPCPDVRAQALILALNYLRDPHQAGRAVQLGDLVERVSATFEPGALGDLGALAGRLGAADTAEPFLEAVGAPNPALRSTQVDDLRAWRLRTQPSWRVATWLVGLRRQPLRSKPAYVWRAVFLDEAELRMAHPDLPPGRAAVFRARRRRLRRGLAAAPDAWRLVRAQPEVVAAPEGGSSGPGLQERLIGTLDRLLPVKRGVVVRTAPDFDDQGLAMCEQLVRSDRRVVWLAAADDAGRLRTVAPDLADRVTVLPARSLRGIWSYLAARTVIHTHGLYHQPPRSRRKRFVNLWHGMPVKRLTERPEVAAVQTDVLTVTSELHAQHLAETWHLPADRIHVTGLPRNDRMLRASQRPRPDALARRVGDRPLVVWLPTYRDSVTGEIRSDGTEFGNPFELPGAGVDAVAALAEELGIRLVVKLHPMAPRRDLGEHGALSIWDEAALDDHGVTLYELLGHADALVTDHSSVWVDYLLLDRPMVFSVADLDAYAATRGHYFTPLAEHLPGPVVADLATLGACLGALLDETAAAAPWAETRARLRPLHHRWLDDRSAERVAALCP